MRLIAVLFLVMLVAGCRPQPSAEIGADTEVVRDTLAVLSHQFSQAYMDGDVAAMVELYTEDAVLFPSNAEYIRGSDAITQYWTLPEGRLITHHAMTPVEVEVSGDMASDFGHYEVSGMNGDEVWGPVHGKYLVVWKRGADGRWRMSLDMWNSRPALAE